MRRIFPALTAGVIPAAAPAQGATVGMGADPDDPGKDPAPTGRLAHRPGAFDYPAD